MSLPPKARTRAATPETSLTDPPLVNPAFVNPKLVTPSNTNAPAPAVSIPKHFEHHLSSAALRSDEVAKPTPTWSLELLCGRLVELSTRGEQGALSFASTLIRESQQRGELAAWVGVRWSTFYPPDMAAAGIDLEQFPVIALEDTSDIPRASEALLRSGAFALLVLDFGMKSKQQSKQRSMKDPFPLPLQTRLAGLAKAKRCTLLALTHKSPRESSLGSLVSVRAHSQRRTVGEGRFACELQVLKDKRFGPCWSSMEFRCGPVGLC